MRPKTDKEIEIMRQGGRILATVLDIVAKQMQVGMSTKDLANIAAKEVKKLGGVPSFLNHDNFTEVMCVSTNDEIVHGMPSPKKKIKQGDVVGLDFGVIYKGLVTDSAITLYVGDKPPADVKRLLDGTKQALYAAVDAVHGDGTKIGDISAAAQKVLDQHNLGIIRDLVGHGVGDQVHEAPNIPNYGIAGSGSKLTTGMTIAIEPMASLGDWHIKQAEDGWTIVMSDGSIGAHFEHTVLITERGAEILTTL